MEDDPDCKPIKIKLEPQILPNENGEADNNCSGSSKDEAQQILPEITSIMSLENCAEFSEERISIKVEADISGVDNVTVKNEPMSEDEDHLARCPAGQQNLSTGVTSTCLSDLDAFNQKQFHVETEESVVTVTGIPDSVLTAFIDSSVAVENESFSLKRAPNKPRPYACELCSAKFKLGADLEAHLPTHFKDNPYRCSQCPMTFRLNASLEKHLLTHSRKKRFFCECCSVEFRSSFQLKSHLQLCNTNWMQTRNKTKMTSLKKEADKTPEPYSCEHCAAKFTAVSELKTHLFIHFKDDRFCCPHCSLTFKVNTGLKKHLLQHSKESRSFSSEYCSKPYACEFCAAKFSADSELKAHIPVHFGDNPFCCDRCPAAFKVLSSLEKHQLTHSDMEHISCDYCSMEFKSSSDLEDHLRVSHMNVEPIPVTVEDNSSDGSDIEIGRSNSAQFTFIDCSVKVELEMLKNPAPKTLKPYACKHCAARFLTAFELQAHLPVHIDDNPFHCSHCAMTFKVSSSLKKHLLTHSDEKYSSCDYCSMEFKSSSQLKDHVYLKHINVYPLSCRHCSTEFKNISKLRAHIPIHFKDYPFLCRYCSANFKLSSSLEKHISVVHSKAKPYSCLQCSLEFRNKVKLKKHIKSHSNKIFTCAHCLAEFKSKLGLKLHILNHSKRRLFSCKFCSATFTTICSYKKHKEATNADGFTLACTDRLTKSKRDTELRTRSDVAPIKKYLLSDLCSVEFSPESTAPKSAAREHLQLASDVSSTTVENEEIIIDSDDEKSVRKNKKSKNPPKPLTATFSCELCAMQFKSESNLKEHIRAHSNKTLFSCEQCSAKFYCSSALKYHFLTHSNRKPYRCKRCPARFTSISEFRSHITIHWNQKTFKCKLCGVQFRQKSDLQTHYYSHI